MFKYITIIYLLVFNTLYAEKIVNLEVNVTMEESGEFVVNESIVYDFEMNKKHGIFREIPKTVYVMGKYKSRYWGANFDIGLDDFSVTLDGTRVDWKLQHIDKSKKPFILISIGSKQQTLSGKHHYVIRYHCRNGILPSSFHQNKDFLHWNAVGDGWHVPILQTVVNLFLPPKLSSSNIEVLLPKEDNIWISKHHLQYIGRTERTTIKVRFPRKLLHQNGADKIEEGIKQYDLYKEKKREVKTFQIKRKDDTFQKNLEKYKWVFWVVFVVLLLWVWLKREQWGIVHSRRSLVVRYSAPKGLSLLQSGLILDNFSDSDDMSAAIVELASLGYLHILSRDTVVLERVERDLKGLSMDQKALLEALFGTNETLKIDTSQRKHAKRLNTQMQKINHLLYNWAEDAGYSMRNFEMIHKKTLNIIVGLTLFMFASSVTWSVLVFDNDRKLSYLIMCLSVAFLPGVLTIFMRLSFWRTVLFTAFGIGVWGTLFSYKLFPKGELTMVEILTNPVSMAFLVFIFSFFVYTHIGRLTPKGKDIRHHLEGLKVYIKSVKEDEIQRRLTIEPLYMEKLLPYAILFGEVAHWLEMYDVLKLPPPKWNSGKLKNLAILRKEFKKYGSKSHGFSLGKVQNSSKTGSTYTSISSGAGGGGGGSW